MSLYRGRLFSLALVALLSAGVVACDDSSDEEEATEQQEADEDEGAEDDEAAEIDVEELPFYATGPVAEIDGHEISADEFNRMVWERAEQMPENVPPQMIEQFKTQSMEHAITKHLVDQTLEGEDVEVTEDDLDEAIEQFKAAFPSEALFEQQLEQMGMTEDELVEEMRQDVKLDLYLREKHDVSVDDEEVREYFDEHEEQFAQQPKVHLRHVVIDMPRGADDETKEEALERAEEIYERAEDGEDFEELARAKSEAPTAERGGDMGFLTRERMMPGLPEVAFEMEPGEISEPVETQTGYHVLQAVDTKDAADPDFEESAEEIEMRLSHQKRAEVFHGFMEDLMDEADIERFEDNIEMNVEAPEAPAHGMPQMPHGSEGGAQPQQGGQIELDTDDLDLDDLELEGEELELELE